jgi:hypothetical protein
MICVLFCCFVLRLEKDPYGGSVMAQRNPDAAEEWLGLNRKRIFGEVEGAKLSATDIAKKLEEHYNARVAYESPSDASFAGLIVSRVRGHSLRLQHTQLPLRSSMCNRKCG